MTTTEQPDVRTEQVTVESLNGDGATRSFTCIERDFSFESYKAAPGLNASLAKWLLVSPAHYQAALTAESEPSMAMEMGSMIHAYVLTGIVPSYVVRPEMDPTDPSKLWNGNRGTCKMWKREQEAAGRLVLKPEESQREIRMCNALADSKDARRCLSACPEREVSLFASYRGVPVKCRVDACSFDRGGLIMDLKKARDASPAGFGKAVATLRYLLSCVWYRNIFSLVTGNEQPPLWAWLAVEDSDAACVQVYRPTDDQCVIGQRQMDRCIDIFLTCSEAGVWPAYGEGDMYFPLPGWYLKEEALT